MESVFLRFCEKIKDRRRKTSVVGCLHCLVVMWLIIKGKFRALVMIVEYLVVMWQKKEKSSCDKRENFEMWWGCDIQVKCDSQKGKARDVGMMR